MYLFIRKIRSSLIQFVSRYHTFRAYLWAFGNNDVKLSCGCSFGSGVKLRVTDGGKLYVKSGTSIASGANITVQSGRLDIGNNVFVGIGSIIVAKESIIIGNDALIAEYVVIRDQDHRYGSGPIKDAGFITGPISIGRDVWIGCKATILRGVSIGDHSVVAAHAVVNEDVPSGVIVAGIPARIIKKIS